MTDVASRASGADPAPDGAGPPSPDAPAAGASDVNRTFDPSVDALPERLVGAAVTDAERADAGPAVIEVKDLGIRYSLRLTKKNTLRQSFVSAFRRKTGPKEFWALRNVEFDLVQGESLGVIGPNGAGKSTLLQVLAGILTPSEGEVTVRGQISSLLTLGAGFDQDLTGRDNILLAGAFLGIPHRDMMDRLEPIIDFADLGEFIDAPIKTYSSGMRARLGFSIATSVDPDVLLLDEVLATGDAVFRAKSKARVLDLVRSAKAIVLVTHDMNWVTEFCNRAMLIEKGTVIVQGEPAEVVALHLEHSEQAKREKMQQIRRYGGEAPKVK